MPDFEPTVNDLALYFSDDNGGLAAHWIPKDVYTNQPCAFDRTWTMANLLEHPVDSSGVCYVVNLSKLLKPGQSPVPATPASMAPVLPGKSVQFEEPRPKDLVIIPPDDANAAYVVRREVYTNPEYCPPIGQRVAEADLNFMALNQGTVLANLPKTTNTSGWTCFLLSLISLKSGALPGINSTDKNAYFAALGLMRRL